MVLQHIAKILWSTILVHIVSALSVLLFSRGYLVCVYLVIGGIKMVKC